MNSAIIQVLEPRAGERFHFGQWVPLSWSSTLNSRWRVELWRYGNFQTVLATLKEGTSMNWQVAPGPSEETVLPSDATGRKPYAAHLLQPNNGRRMEEEKAKGAKRELGHDTVFGTWFANGQTDRNVYWSGFMLTPGDRYTIRVCPDSWGMAGTGMYHCDETGYAASGEFDILASIDVTSPPTGFVISASGEQEGNAYSPFVNNYIPVAYTSYFTDGAYMSVRLIDAVTGYTVDSKDIVDNGAYDYYVPTDAPTGSYYVQVTAECESATGNGCALYQNRFMGSAGSQSGSTATGKSGVFSILGHGPRPPPPNPPPAPAPPPNAPFELPIIKAFQAQFGGGAIQQIGSGANAYTTQSTVSGGDDCAYICRVADVMGGRRRLLFGGLQSFSAGTEVIGCSRAQIDCNCQGCVG